MKYLRLIFLATVIIGLSGCRTEKKNDARKPVLVRVIEVEEKSNIESKTHIGTAQAVKSNLLTSPQNGTLIRVKKKVGDSVQKGEIIAEIDSKTAKTTFEITQATLKQAEDGHRRARQVYQNGGIADVKMIEIETQLSKARAAAEAAKENLEACCIKAPYDGVITEVFAEVDIEVGLAEPIARIADVSSIELRIAVPETEIADIEIGDMAYFDIPAIELSRQKAKVVKKGIIAKPMVHTYDCVLSPTSKNADILPGMVCKLKFENETEKGIVIPAKIVQVDKNGRYVWVVEDSKVKKIPVVVSGFSGKGIVITEGLKVGDKIISEGYQKVSTGMQVNIIE